MSNYMAVFPSLQIWLLLTIVCVYKLHLLTYLLRAVAHGGEKQVSQFLPLLCTMRHEFIVPPVTVSLRSTDYCVACVYKRIRGIFSCNLCKCPILQ